MPLPAELAKLIPESNSIDFRQLRGDAHSNALEQAYSPGGGGFVGCFLDDEDSPWWQRRIARYGDDEFMGETEGAKLFSEVVDDLKADDGDGCHVYSRHAIECHSKDGEYQHDGPFSVFQDFGICVESSGIYTDNYLLGVRAKKSSFREQMKFLSAHYQYAERGYCYHGWYMGARARESEKRGWCPAMLIDVEGNRLEWDNEDEHEYTVAQKWCRSGIPDWLSRWTRDNFAYDSNAITYFDLGTDALKKLFAAGGVFHHGSNYTSGSRRPNTLKRIGGHAQPAMGGDWSEETLKWFFDEHGIRYTVDDFPCPQGQQWGPNWSGRLDHKYWPTHRWGPMPEGSWLISSKQLLSGKFDGYAYLPKMMGVPSDGPPAPPDPAPEIVSKLWVDPLGEGRYAIRGAAKFGDHEYIAAPDASGDYKFVPKPVI